MRRLVKILVLLLFVVSALVMGLIVCFCRGGPLYAMGNVRKSAYLTNFGFVRELPKDFLQPADLIMRLNPSPGYGDQLYIEYMPDKTYIHLIRLLNSNYPVSPHRTARRRPLPLQAELARTYLMDCGHLLPNLPLRYCDAIDQPNLSKKVLANSEYDCAESAMAIDGGAIDKAKIKESDKYQGLVAVRFFNSGKQTLAVIAITPGHAVNLPALNELLSCLDLK